MTKTPSGDFQVTTPEIPLLSKQAVTSKGIPIPYTNLQLNPYPNTQLHLFYSKNFSFRCTAPKYVTHHCTNPSTWLQSPTKEGCSVPYTNLQLNPYPNTQLHLFYSNNFSFRCTAPKYVTHHCTNPSTWLQSPTKEGCWLQSSSVHPNDEDQEDTWSQNPTVHIHSNFFTRMIN